MKNGLKSRDFERRGVCRSGWWASLFCVFDAADNMAIGEKLYYHAKVGSFRDSVKSFRDNIRVLRDNIQINGKNGMK